MKLKKIASLALAGVMAVSMLAGCAGKTGTTPDEGTTVVATGAAAAAKAFNDVQDTVEFSTDTTLQNALNQTVKDAGTLNWNENAVKNYIELITGENYVDAFTADTKNTETILVPMIGTSANYWSEDAALAAAKTAMKATVADYKDTTYDKDSTPVDGTYYDYTYTGDVAVASVTNGEGVTTYYLVYTVTRSVTEQTYVGK